MKIGDRVQSLFVLSRKGTVRGYSRVTDWAGQRCVVVKWDANATTERYCRNNLRVIPSRVEKEPS